MSLKQQSATSGAWLFRWRSYLPLVFVIFLLPAISRFSYPFGSHTYDIIWEMFCFAVSLIGLAIRCYTIGYTPKNTSGRNTKRQIADTLNTSGIYSITRNPLYLGNFFMMLGVVLFPRGWWTVLVYVLAFWLYYERIIMAEEIFLKSKFGQKYEEYCLRTPVFVPNCRLWQRPSLSFSFKNVLKREYSGFFGVIAAFTVLEVLGEYLIEGKIILDPIWVTIFLIGLFIYLALRTLKKKTRLLHVVDR